MIDTLYHPIPTEVYSGPDVPLHVHWVPASLAELPVRTVTQRRARQLLILRTGHPKRCDDFKQVAMKALSLTSAQYNAALKQAVAWGFATYEEQVHWTTDVPFNDIDCAR